MLLFSCYFSSIQPSKSLFFLFLKTQQYKKGKITPRLFQFFIVVCLPKQYYKSNSAAVNRQQDWSSSAVSHRGCHIINTDLYCSLRANIHKCQYASSLMPVKIHEAIWINFMNSTKRLAVKRKQARGRSEEEKRVIYKLNQ